MAGGVKRTEPVWVFGSKYELKIYESSVALSGILVGPEQQKNRIVLHITDANNPAEQSVGTWHAAWFHPEPGKNPLKVSANYVVERVEGLPNQDFANVVEIVESKFQSFHAGEYSNNSVGIEHAVIGRMGHQPIDPNQYFDLQHYQQVFRGGRKIRADWGPANKYFQVFTEEQYLAMILLLRFLCRKHRIPCRFLGDTVEEKVKYWADPARPLTLNKLRRFRGILSHMNVSLRHGVCGGPAMHRNRLFRGIIDEWWPPVQFDGEDRTYYSGPFDPQPHQAGQQEKPSLFRWQGGNLDKRVFQDADLEALQETTSYYDFDKIESYYSESEREDLEGTFPIGKNKVWHGGIHLSPPESNRKVYAAASGTIVAARLGGNSDVERDIGSQRFVLIRHGVYLQREADPSGDVRTPPYTVDPTYVFTLYMHLEQFARLDSVDDNNPPWFNYWLRHRASIADPNVVFSPDVELAVGDWLGECGTYFDRRMIHFEVMSQKEFQGGPWFDPILAARDPGTDEICDPAVLNRFVLDRTGNGIDDVDILRAARDLRVVKSFHKSEWALANANALSPVIREGQTREQKWEKLKHFMWVTDAVNKHPALAAELCDANGMIWHYHPFTFMDFVNRLVLEENGEVSEPDFRNTNVTMEGGYLRRFVDFTSGSAVPVPADNTNPTKIKPFDLVAPAEYGFTREDIACRVPGTHSPGPTPPEETLFHVSLLDILQNIRDRYGQLITVNLSHVCMGHNIPTNSGECVIGALDSHAGGHAVDISPATRSPAQCRALWEKANEIVQEYNIVFPGHAGEPSRADLPANFTAVAISTNAAIQVKLERGQALTGTEANRFVLHLELVEGPHP